MKKISVTISGHRTSLTLEREFVDALRKIATLRHTTISKIINDIDFARQNKNGMDHPTNLSSSVRVWVLKQLLPRTPK